MPVALLALQVLLVSAVAQALFACHLIGRSLPKEIICATYKSGAHACYNAVVSTLKLIVLPSEQDPLDKKIGQLIVRSRLELFTNMLPIGVAINTWLLLSDLIRNRLCTVLAWSWYGASSEEDVAELMSPWVMILFRQMVTLFFLAYPRAINPTSVRLGASLVYFRLTVEACMQKETDFAAWVASTAPTRVGAAVMLGEKPTAACLNILVSAVSCWCYTADWHINFNVILCSITWAIIYGIDCMKKGQFRAVLKARRSHSVEVAADGLLSRLCDAVVHLGEDLRITQPSPQLAALLLRPSFCSGMKNVSFLDVFSCKEESERIRGFLLRDTPGADTLHSSMKDSNGVVVAVQLFHVCGQDFDDQIFHVVGVREDSESFRMPPESQAPPVTTIDAPLVEHTPSDVESVRTLELESDSGDLAVYFRLFETGYPVEKCSAGFTVLSGPSGPGARLLEWVVSTESFIECVQELGDSALREGQDLHVQRSVQVRLRPPHLHQLGRELSAEAVFSLLHNDTAADVQLWTAKVELRDTKVVRKRGRNERAQFRPLSQQTASSIASIEESVDELDMLEEMEVYFDVFDEGYIVTSCPPRFASLVGLPEMGIRMLDLVADEETFITQAQLVFNRAYQSGDFTVSKICENVHLKRPRRSHGFHATIELSMDHNSSANDVQMWTVKAKLHAIVKSPRHDRLGELRPGGQTALQAAAWASESSTCRPQRRRPRATPSSHRS